MRVRDNKRLQERGKANEERKLMASSYSKLSDNMKALPQSIYHEKNSVCVCVCVFCVSDCTAASLASFLCVYVCQSV